MGEGEAKREALNLLEALAGRQLPQAAPTPVSYTHLTLPTTERV